VTPETLQRRLLVNFSSIGAKSDRRNLPAGRSSWELANFTHESIAVYLWHFDIISIPPQPERSSFGF
jgi:hypothetical protein